MEQLTAAQIIDAIGAEKICGDDNACINRVSIDSRDVDENTLFIPLKGEKADGHDYIDKAIEKGVPILLTQRDMKPRENVCILRVADTLKAMGALAHFYLNLVQVRVVAVTGSVGKTSTKEMIASVLSQKFRVVKTQGNYNNHIGLPLTVFRLTRQDEIAVLEMGMNHFGEIDYLAGIANPDVAVITNIGVSHIENLGSREGILKSKMEIARHIKPGGKLVINVDNDMLQKVTAEKPKFLVTYGVQNEKAMLRATDISVHPEGVNFAVKHGGNVYKVSVPALGEYHVYNALCALCVGEQFGMKMPEMIQGVTHFENTGLRMHVETVKDYTVLVDCYNAAPDSMRAALTVLFGFKNPRRVAILGDMFELGFYAETAHRGVGMEVAKQKVDVLIAIGSLAQEYVKGAIDGGFSKENIHWFCDTAACEKELLKLLKPQDVVLLKASRGMAFEEILHYLER